LCSRRASPRVHPHTSNIISSTDAPGAIGLILLMVQERVIAFTHNCVGFSHTMRNRTILAPLFATLALASIGFGQTPESRAHTAPSELQSLQDSINTCGEEIELMQHFLEASTVDPAFTQYTTVKSWVINNPVLRDSLFYALLQSDSSLQSETGADPEVMATPWDDLIQVRLGTAVFKGMTLKKALDKSADKTLYKKIAESYRYSKDVELRDPSFRLETPLQPELLSTEIGRAHV
jgi:hypothetical protein